MLINSTNLKGVLLGIKSKPSPPVFVGHLTFIQKNGVSASAWSCVVIPLCDTKPPLWGALNRFNCPTLVKQTQWMCYFEHHDEEDAYVIRPFPSMWKCGVVVPDGLDPLSFDTKHLQGLCRSLEILVHMRKGRKEFGLACGSECTGNEGCNQLSVVLMPWEGDEVIPNALTIFSKIFEFYQEIWDNPQSICCQSFDEKLYFHLDEHPRDERPKRACLNKVFGRPHQNFWKDKEYNYEKELDFFTWLQNIMVPSRRYIAGESKMNPVAEFFITVLAPGWVGGILTGETWT